MDLTGKNFITGELSSASNGIFRSVDPARQSELPPDFYEASVAEIDRALEGGAQAHENYRAQSPEKIACFLERIGEEIIGLGDALLRRAELETALPAARLTGERARTVNQLKMFAELVREGSWVEASIDRAQPERKPLAKPDLRRKLISIGPVAVFGASNFPLAFSVAGGDTASALAAGNPVVVKAHPAHPGTSELVASAIKRAVETSGLPAGVFSMLHGRSHEVSLRVVRHSATKAVAFTGSLQGGRTLFNAAGARPEPVPVYAEMGSTNPIFVLPDALKKNAASIAEGFVQSVTLGVGQFCTNPGLVFGLNDDGLKAFAERAGELAKSSPAAAMLYQGICDRFHEGATRVLKIPGVTISGRSSAPLKAGQASALVMLTTFESFSEHEALREELFGPASLIVRCQSAADLEQAARELPGQLTATIHGTEEDLAQHAKLVELLQQKAGRIIFNGFPTGVEVCPSMQHGGPYPATTDVHFTSVGTGAIKRFARPVCFQNFPQAALPPELQNKNVRNIWRLIDGKMTREDVG
jgi:NADP-dependent aldehyde dehydrogenase